MPARMPVAHQKSPRTDSTVIVEALDDRHALYTKWVSSGKKLCTWTILGANSSIAVLNRIASILSDAYQLNFNIQRDNAKIKCALVENSIEPNHFKVVSAATSSDQPPHEAGPEVTKRRDHAELADAL